MRGATIRTEARRAHQAAGVLGVLTLNATAARREYTPAELEQIAYYADELATAAGAIAATLRGLGLRDPAAAADRLRDLEQAGEDGAWGAA